MRASFRSRAGRPRTSIEGARTPSKVDSRIRLREKKARSLERHMQNRWVEFKIQHRDHQFGSLFETNVGIFLHQPWMLELLNT